MSQASIEQRLAAVEAAVNDLQRRLECLSPAPNWLDQITDSFEEVIQ